MTTETNTSIFTKIINREIPANIVYEDDLVLAFLTIEPINHGHTLVVPKKPFINIFDGDSEILGHMMKIAKKIAGALVEQNLGTGVNVHMNNGTVAGQEVFHAHLHVIPRLENDEVFQKPTHVTFGEDEAKKIAQKINEGLDKYRQS